MVGGGMFDGIGLLFWGFIIGGILSILGIGYFLYNVFFVDHKEFKTTEKPTITWELKADKQTVDTVWIYKFK